MSNKGFDEYGNYGENNPPIREMTEEERQRAKEREEANQTSVDEMADRIEELETENKNLRHMIIDQISSAGDDPEIMAASRAEWAARALAAEARINELKATLKKLEYWFDTDQEILDVMGNNEKADHMRKLKMIRDALGGDSDE